MLGPDGRVQESISATSPWASIVHIESNRGGCSGFLINRDTVVTAGHCVYNGGWATSYTVYPGRNGLNYKPYGSCSGGAADLWSNSIWTSSQHADYDYGMIKLTCDVGNSTGWMGCGQPAVTRSHPGAGRERSRPAPPHLRCSHADNRHYVRLREPGGVLGAAQATADDVAAWAATELAGSPGHRGRPGRPLCAVALEVF